MLWLCYCGLYWVSLVLILCKVSSLHSLVKKANAVSDKGIFTNMTLSLFFCIHDYKICTRNCCCLLTVSFFMFLLIMKLGTNLALSLVSCFRFISIVSFFSIGLISCISLLQLYPQLNASYNYTFGHAPPFARNQTMLVNGV